MLSSQGTQPTGTILQHSRMPLDHLVVLKLKPDVDEVAFFAAAHTLKKIPGVVSVSVGRNWVPEGAGNRGNGFTHGISVRFESKEDLMPYQVHEHHVYVKDNHIVPNLDGPPGPSTIMALDWEPAKAPWRLLGSENSPYSIKVRSYFRYKSINHRWILKQMASEESAEIANRAKLPIVPTVSSPDESILQDSTPIIELLEASSSSGPSIHPASASMRFLSCLLEEFSDEWVAQPYPTAL